MLPGGGWQINIQSGKDCLCSEHPQKMSPEPPSPWPLGWAMGVTLTLSVGLAVLLLKLSELIFFFILSVLCSVLSFHSCSSWCGLNSHVDIIPAMATGPSDLPSSLTRWHKCVISRFTASLWLSPIKGRISASQPGVLYFDSFFQIPTPSQLR